MKKNILTEIKTKKTKHKQKQKNILTPNFFTGLIVMQRVLIIFLKLVKQSNKEKLKELENIITDQEDKIKEQENKI